MYIFDKKDDSIDLYTIEAKKNELKEYKRKILENNKDNLLYYLITNSKETMKMFITSEELSIDKIKFSTYLWDYMRTNVYSSFEADYGSNNIAEIQKKSDNFKKNGFFEGEDVCLHEINVIKQYINGVYDNFPLVRVINKNLSDFYLLRTENNKSQDVLKIDNRLCWQLQNILKLPRNLQILQLLLQGKYEKINEGEITDQLGVFNIDYYNSIKLNDIKDLYASGLVKGSYESTLKKASYGSRILKKYKK